MRRGRHVVVKSGTFQVDPEGRLLIYVGTSGLWVATGVQVPSSGRYEPVRKITVG